MVAKLLLHDVMLIDGVSDQRLAALLGVDRDTVRHLRAPMHSSTVGAIGEAFRAIGLRLVIAAHSVAATEDTAD
ncbi:hypothetical protein [Paracraurococcus ruber]|uniref:Transcriptional regulator n=2 Tax=Paracraurococcus ruber TaxID=77675 RepID=A0ABS1D797_9PROT|nr:hypothetical protein [Paracraurococcus ruber]MBK1662350.1 hypothetical protein [Paracraurococcus ruber]TDG11735.1 hypothetical protein E2C05_30715 [Paracraurococcus ruber]